MKSVEMLMDFGFNLYESKILISLTNLKSATAKEIGKSSGVPVNKIYEILDILKRKGVIQLLPSKPKKYDIVNLKQILRNRVNDKKKNLESMSKKLDKFFEELNSTKSYEETFWIMEGVESMINKIIETLEDTKEESIGFVDIWVAPQENIKAVRKAIKRGVKFYFLGTIDKHTKPMAKKYAKIGVKIKHYPIQGAGYSIFDGKNVQLRVTENKVINLWVDNEHFAQILRQHFFELWKKSKPVKF